jgi:hypothetical protein
VKNVRYNRQSEMAPGRVTTYGNLQEVTCERVCIGYSKVNLRLMAEYPVLATGIEPALPRVSETDISALEQ